MAASFICVFVSVQTLDAVVLLRVAPGVGPVLQLRICAQGHGAVCSMQMFRIQEPEIMYVNVGFMPHVCPVRTSPR